MNLFCKLLIWAFCACNALETVGTRCRKLTQRTGHWSSQSVSSINDRKFHAPLNGSHAPNDYYERDERRE